MGLDMVSRANNHATDWGVAGLRSTSAVLDEAGLVHAGAGESLTAARAPRYLSTRQGRVALVSAATRYQPMSLASDQFGIVPARPGINGLRTKKWFAVHPAELVVMASIRDSLPPESLHHTARGADARDGSVTLQGTAFISSDTAGGRVGPYWRVEEEDIAALRTSVRQAKQSADIAVVALHTREPGNYSAEPSQHPFGLLEFADAQQHIHQQSGLVDGRGVLLVRVHPAGDVHPLHDESAREFTGCRTGLGDAGGRAAHQQRKQARAGPPDLDRIPVG
jgi:poly-gamma-glutamate capsule biosynthesis protein CapA/YwtB (metallophosphatase superfamily)